jgi:hypothetical protein
MPASGQQRLVGPGAAVSAPGRTTRSLCAVSQSVRRRCRVQATAVRVAVRACLSEQTGSEAAEVQEHRAPMTAMTSRWRCRSSFGSSHQGQSHIISQLSP